jgi:hypothetical protein
MPSSELSNLISAIANVVMAVGIVFAAGQYFFARRQTMAQLEIHVVELHIHFQQQMREIQKAFPPSVNDPSWIPQSNDEKRAVRMYWYLVFDEWVTCKYLSKERRLNALWDRYRYGVISALSKPAFDSEVRDMFARNAIFFGLAKEFMLEIEECRQAVKS